MARGDGGEAVPGGDILLEVDWPAGLQPELEPGRHDRRQTRGHLAQSREALRRH
jgi:hypothetical protein